jgi:hypothetical protein
LILDFEGKNMEIDIHKIICVLVGLKSYNTYYFLNGI